MNIKNYKVKYDGTMCAVVAEGIRGTERVKASGPEAVAKVMQDIAEINQSPCEQFWVMHLNGKMQIIAVEMISQGGINASMAHPREVFRSAIIRNSYAVILCHNHPSGDTVPSAEDRSTTQKLIDAGKVVGIRVFDHIIIGDDYYSMKEHELLEF